MFKNIVAENLKIIAEAGVNHNGCLNRALKMVEIAADCGVDYIKFQTFKTENLVTKTANCADYQQKNINDSQTTKSQFTMLKELELSFGDFEKIVKHCQKLKIGFLSTAFDGESLNFLLNMDMDYLKIPSGEITNYPYLRDHASTGKSLIMSTGMSNLSEVDDAVNVLKIFNPNVMKNLTLMHCTTEYPAPVDELNLQAMNVLAENFDCDIGYSDHSKGIHVPLVAATLGAKIIEKHFTLDKNLSGPDHKASLESNELKLMTENIRDVYKMMGKNEKIVTKSEFKNCKIARKSIVAKNNIMKGTKFSENNLTVKRVENEGISPMQWENVINSVAQRNFVCDEVIEL